MSIKLVLPTLSEAIKCLDLQRVHKTSIIPHPTGVSSAPESRNLIFFVVGRFYRSPSPLYLSEAVLGLQINKRVNIEPILSGVVAMV